MAYNLSVVRANVRNRLDDSDYEDTFLDRAINYAQWQITNKHQLKFMETSDTLTLASAAVEVSLPATHHETISLRIATPTASQAVLTDLFTHYDDFINAFIYPSGNTASIPYHWTEYGQKIKFSAPADQEYTLAIDFLRKSAKLENEADVPDIPEEFQELLELGAYMRIAKREDDYDVKNQEMMDYQSLLNDLLHVYGRNKQPGGMRTMRISRRV